MPAYTLAQAIAATGRSRSALIRAIRSGKLSASRDASGAYLVDPSELQRVYPGTGNGTPPGSPIDTPRHADLAALLAAEQAKNGVLIDTVTDLRRRLDVATEQLGEALQQVRVLTDQRTAPPVPTPVPPRRSWWSWLRR
jgi:hypothetical protein